MGQLAIVSFDQIAESVIVFEKLEVQSQRPIEENMDQKQQCLTYDGEERCFRSCHYKNKNRDLVTNKYTTCDQQFSTLQFENLADEGALSSPIYNSFCMILDAHAKGKRLYGVLEKVKVVIPKSQH